MHSDARGAASRRLVEAIRSDLTVPGAPRRAASAHWVDEWLGDLWAAACAQHDIDGAGLALATVGSHARRDSGPGGDLDLILLHDGSLSASSLGRFADALWYPIWDNGFRLDHAVRTPTAQRQTAAEDLAVAVAGLQVRQVAGDSNLISIVAAGLRQDWRRDARVRLPQVAATLADRLARHGDLSDLLEPDLKHARGGLRDTVLIDAIVSTWLADSPHDGWRVSRDRLLDVRDALQAVTGRAVDRLILPEQDAVAAVLGMADADDLLTTVSSCGRDIALALDETLRAALRALPVRRGLRRARAPRIHPVEPGIAIHDGEVVTLPGGAWPADSMTLLRAAVVAARTGTPLAPGNVRRLAASMPDQGEQWADTARQSLVEMLGTGEPLLAVWEILDHAGVIAQWLPPWDAIRSRPQRNAVHRFTVDRHCVQTCVEAARRGLTVARPDLLLMACLLHDIGKHPGERDHAAAGARIAGPLCRRLGWDAADTEVIVRLVAQHLTLVELATRRDPDDPATVQAVVDAVAGDGETLRMLRLLTEADARAAGPGAWSAWRARLVDDLVARAGEALTGRAVPSPSPLTEVEAALVEQVRFSGIPAVRVSELADAPAVTVVAPDRPGLFADLAGILAAQDATVRSALVRTVDGVAVDTWWTGGRVPDPALVLTALRRLTTGDTGVLDRLQRREAAHRPMASADQPCQVFLVPGASHEASVIEVHAPDRPGLLHALGTALRETGVDIRSAHVTTLAGRAVDVLYLAEAGGGLLPPARTAQVIRLLTEAAGIPPQRR